MQAGSNRELRGEAEDVVLLGLLPHPQGELPKAKLLRHSPFVPWAERDAAKLVRWVNEVSEVQWNPPPSHFSSWFFRHRRHRARGLSLYRYLVSAGQRIWQVLPLEPHWLRRLALSKLLGFCG